MSALVLLSMTLVVGELPDPKTVTPTLLFEVPSYCEGVVFDHEGRGYVSHGDTITRFTLDGKNETFVKYAGAPNGHKILADGSHIVCDAKQHAICKFDKTGKQLDHASKECDGKPLRGPNDLTLDPAGGFYFTDPGDSGKDNPIGTVHYVDPQGKTHLVAQGLAYPNGIVLVPGGKKLLVAESQKNRVLEYTLDAPGKAPSMKVFADLPTKAGQQIDNQPDGMCLDAAGNLYVAHYGMKQVQVLDPTGKLIARYDGGNLTTSNVAFGSPTMDKLFVTGGIAGEGKSAGGIFRLDLGTKGLTILPAAK